jgi:AraC family transcriptional regulator, regulatory protein of adaptative response / methylated-DNA-[protein]-cysteine methyltransferase
MNQGAATLEPQISTYATADCSLGVVLVAASDKGVCGIFLGDDVAVLVRAMQTRFSGFYHTSVMAGRDELLKKIVSLIENPTLTSDLSLDVRGTTFQRRVWQALCEIPIGTTLSYSQVAEKIGSPKSVRAIAGACAANNLAVVIPCHRVIRSDGQLAGYRWGIERKRTLLAREAKLN